MDPTDQRRRSGCGGTGDPHRLYLADDRDPDFVDQPGAGGDTGLGAGFRAGRAWDDGAAATGRECAAALALPALEGCPGFHASCRRSEEHTSELQSLMRISYAVFCLKKTNI